VTWKWTNWCGDRSVRAEVVGPGGAVEELPLRTLPRCTDRATASVLTRSAADAGPGGPLRRPTSTTASDQIVKFAQCW
jgi:hypothetical protein